MSRLKQFLIAEDAATAVEYAVMLALILIGVISAISSVGAGSGGLWSNNSTQLQSAFSP
jgi:pilus assembly protein Flp/PilA